VTPVTPETAESMASGKLLAEMPTAMAAVNRRRGAGRPARAGGPRAASRLEHMVTGALLNGAARTTDDGFE